MLRHYQSTLAAWGLSPGKPATLQSRVTQKARASPQGGVWDTLQGSISFGHLAVTESAGAGLKLLAAFTWEVKQVCGLVFWLVCLYANIWAAALAVLALPSWIALGCLMLQGALILLPLGDEPPRWAARILRFSIQSAVKFFPMRLVMEDEAALQQQGGKYIVAFEPHSALPLAMPGVFCEYSGLLPPALSGIKTLASSSIFFVPGLRHAWHWLGLRPVSRKVMASILSSGGSVALCPGGVKECLHMRHGEEVVYLRRRTGFVRMAMQQGADILPAFAFGQTYMYSWRAPGPPLLPRKAVEMLARGIGFLPLLIYGVKGTPMPHRVPITVAMGRPFKVPHIDNPTPEQVKEQLDRFIVEMERLVEAHSAEAGYPNIPLRVY